MIQQLLWEANSLLRLYEDGVDVELPLQILENYGSQYLELAHI